MLNIRAVRESPESVRAALARRDPAAAELLDEALRLDHRRRDLLKEVEGLKADRNTQSQEVARKKKSGEDAAELLGALKQLSDAIKNLDDETSGVDTALEHTLLQIPNPPLDDVPTGGEEANEIVRTWGERPSFAFTPRPHWELGDALGILDMARGAKVTGSGFPVFVGQGARLVRALTSFMLDIHTGDHGYTEIAPPLMVNADSARGTGQLPDKEGTMYVTADGFYLVPTAEVPLTNLHRDEILPATALPVAYAAYTPCFRREAGAHGKDTRGLIRVHQFDKVELVRFTRPEDSVEALELLVTQAATVLERLELPYRVLSLATGDLGFASARTYDLEVWAPGVDRWLEVSSASTFADFQARRANIRYRPTPSAKPSFVHTLNASGVAFPRTIIALLENHQHSDGSVRLPDALAPYVGADRLTAGDD